MSTSPMQIPPPQTVVSAKLSPDLVVRLKHVAEIEDRTMSNLLRQAIKAYLAGRDNS